MYSICVGASKAKRHGLRNPDAQISGRTPGRPTNGLEGGTRYGRTLTSRRSILPSRTPMFCALFGTSSQHSDRKSTRLNSSHANISYAVFCLKKKPHHRLPPHPRVDKNCTLLH